MSRPLPEVVSFLQAMPEEEIKPQMAIIHGISTFLTMRRRAVLGGGAVCFEELSQIASSQMTWEPFFSFLQCFRTNDYYS